MHSLWRRFLSNFRLGCLLLKNFLCISCAIRSKLFSLLYISSPVITCILGNILQCMSHCTVQTTYTPFNVTPSMVFLSLIASSFCNACTIKPVVRSFCLWYTVQLNIVTNARYCFLYNVLKVIVSRCAESSLLRT